MPNECPKGLGSFAKYNILWWTAQVRRATITSWFPRNACESFSVLVAILEEKKIFSIVILGRSSAFGYIRINLSTNLFVATSSPMKKPNFGELKAQFHSNIFEGVCFWFWRKSLFLLHLGNYILYLVWCKFFECFWPQPRKVDGMKSLGRLRNLSAKFSNGKYKDLRELLAKLKML